MILDQHIINVSASIGWHYTTDVAYADLDNMIKASDRAMYKEKELKNGRKMRLNKSKEKAVLGRLFLSIFIISVDGCF